MEKDEKMNPDKKDEVSEKEMQQRVLAYMVYKNIWDDTGKSIELDKLSEFMEADGFLTMSMERIRNLIKANLEKIK